MKNIKEKINKTILLAAKCLWIFLNSFIEPFKSYIYTKLFLEEVDKN